MSDLNKEIENQKNTENNASPQSVADKGPNATLLRLVEQQISFQKEALSLFKSNNRFVRVKFIAATIVGIIFIISAIKAVTPGTNVVGPAHVNVIDLQGAIGVDSAINAERTVPLLEKAYSDPAAKGVILKINSPGGSPVQSSIIHDRILALKKKYNKKTIVVGEDMIASGGYFIAVAADKIVVNRSTLIGSIGVIHSSFGFSGLLGKLGIDRRVITAGESKDKLDPFLPLKETDKEFMDVVLKSTHEHFKDVVKEGRKGKINLSDPHIFDGSVWTGDASIQNGIADAQGDLWTVLQTEFNNAKPVYIQAPENVLNGLFRQMGVELGTGLLGAVSNVAPSQLN